MAVTLDPLLAHIPPISFLPHFYIHSTNVLTYENDLRLKSQKAEKWRLSNFTLKLRDIML